MKHQLSQIPNVLFDKMIIHFIYILLLIGAGVLSFSPLSYAEAAADLSYTENEDGTITVTGYASDSVFSFYNLVIPTTIDGKCVTAIADSAFKDCSFTTCLISNNITIGEHAFENASFRGTLTIGDDSTGCNRIGSYAFKNASFVSVISIVSNIEIGDYAFLNTLMADPGISQPDSVTYSVGKGAFQNSQYVSGLNYSGLVSIGENAFSGSRIQQFTICPSVQSIEKNAFALDGERLSRAEQILYIDPDVKDISPFHLEDLEHTIFYVYQNTPVIEYCQTHDMPFYCSYTLGGGLPAVGQVFASTDSYVRVNEDDTVTLLYIITDTDSIDLNQYQTYTYKDHIYTLSAVDAYALNGVSLHTDLTEIILPDSITRLEAHALDYKSPLTITLSSNIEYVGESAFPDFEETTVKLPADTASLSESLCPGIWNSKALFLLAQNSPLIPVFEAHNCRYQTYTDTSNLPGTSFTENGIIYTRNEDNTLSVTGYDSSLALETSSNIKLYNTVDGKKVTDIANAAFKDFPHSTELFIDNDIVIGSHAFQNMRIDRLTIGANALGENEIGKYAFAGSSLTNVCFYSNVILKDYCFQNAAFSNSDSQHTASIYQPDSATLSIGTGAFHSSGYNGGLNMDAVTSIGDYAFYGTPCLEFTISASLQSIGKEAFPSHAFREPYAAYRIFHIDAAVTDISRFSIEDLSSETILYIDADSPLVSYCVEHSIPFFLTNDTEDNSRPAYAFQALSNDTCVVMVTGEQTARLLDLFSNDETLTLDETFSISYHGHNYTLDSIGSYAISDKNCPCVENVVLGNNITLLEGAAFSNSSYLTKIKLSERLEIQLTKTGTYALPNRNHLTVEIPVTVISPDELHLDCCPLATFLVAKNSPLISYLESHDLKYELTDEEYIAPEQPEQPEQPQQPEQPEEETFTKDHLIYSKKEDGAWEVTGYDDAGYLSEHTVHIHHTVDGKTVTSIADSAFKGLSLDQGLSIDNDIAIGAHAFEKTRIGGSCAIGTDTSGSNRIGQYAFANASIVYITVHSNVEYGDYSFLNTAFDDCMIHQSEPAVQRIGKGAFQNSRYRSGINCSAVTYIGEHAFSDSEITEFTIFPSMQTIEEGAFAILNPGYFLKQNAQKLYIDESVTDIRAFHLDTLKYTLFCVDAGSPLVEYFTANHMPFFLTNDPADSLAPARNSQVISNDACTVKVTGEHTAALIDLHCEEDTLHLDEAYNVEYHGHTYTIDTIECIAISDGSCPNLSTIVFGENITRFQNNCCVLTRDKWKITLPSHIDELYDYSFSGHGMAPTVTLPAAMTTLSDEIADTICQSNWRLLVAENSPLLSVFSDKNRSYEIYEVKTPDQSDLNDSGSPDNGSDPDDTNHSDGSDPSGSDKGSNPDDTGHSAGTGSSDPSDGNNDPDGSNSSAGTDSSDSSDGNNNPDGSDNSAGTDSSDPSDGNNDPDGSDNSAGTNSSDPSDGNNDPDGSNSSAGTDSSDPSDGNNNPDGSNSSAGAGSPDSSGNNNNPDNSNSSGGTDASGSSDNDGKPNDQSADTPASTGDGNTQKESDNTESATSTENDKAPSDTQENKTADSAEASGGSGSAADDGSSLTSDPTRDGVRADHPGYPDAASSNKNNDSSSDLFPAIQQPASDGQQSVSDSAASGTQAAGSSSGTTEKADSESAQTDAVLSRPAKGTLITVKKLQYKVTGKKTVAFIKPSGKTITRLTIPATITYRKYTFRVTKIDKNACKKCTKLKKVTIGNNVSQIGDSAFSHCSALTSITFGSGVKTLGKRVLYNDRKLSKIVFQSKKIKSIGKKTFHNVPKRVNILVPNSKVAKYSKLINNAK